MTNTKSLKPPSDTVDGRICAPSRMYKTLQKMGKTTNLNWLAGFLPSTALCHNADIC